MARLKSRDRFPPGEFQVLHPEAGQKEPFHGSFMEAVQFETNFRSANPQIVKQHGWTINRSEIEAFVDRYNAHRCIAGGWLDFVWMEGEPSIEPPSPDQKKSWRSSVVGKVERIASGKRLLQDWLGSDQRPVDKPLAEKRASVCAICPKNDGGDFASYFTEPIANEIRYLLGVKHDMDLKTSYDEKLTVCSACDCPLPLKVWSPLDLIRKHTSGDTLSRLDPGCWVLKELQ